VILATVALLAVPGFLVARGFGLPVLVSLGVAAPVTYGVVGLAVTVLPPLGIPWRLETFVVLTALLAGTATVARRLMAPHPTPEPTAAGWTRTAVGCVTLCCFVAAGVGGLVADRATIGFTAFAQGYDATFHANAIRVTADSSDASSTVLAAVNDVSRDGYFYPSGYHALSALLVQSGVSVERAMDVQAGLLSLWLACGIAVLAWAVRSRAVIAGTAAILSCAVVSLPYDLFNWGPLFPFVTAAIMVPGGLAVTVVAVDRLAGRFIWVLAGLVLAGSLTLHTSVALATVIFIVALLLQRSISRPRDTGRLVARLAGVAVVMLLAGESQVSGALVAGSQTASGDVLQTSWPIDRTIGQAAGELLTFSAHTVHPQLWLAGALFVGLTRLGRMREWWWFLAGGAVFAAFFVLVASVSTPSLHLLTVFWWNDRYRFAALAVPALVVLAAAGLVRIADALTALLRRLTTLRERGNPFVPSALAATIVLLLFAVLTGGFYRSAAETQMGMGFGAGPSGGVPERTALEYLGNQARGEGRVLNDPFDGSAWMWAAEGVKPVFGQALFFPNDRQVIGSDRNLLYDDFHALDTDPAVRAAVTRLDVRFVFVGDRMLNRFIPRAPGLTGLDAVRSLQLVYRNGEASVYRVLDAP
jgi:hypothetical protein